jgi:polysaccharide pyruvyl transferase WcaK-like protein
MTTRLFIGNDYFGAGNFGDDLTLAGFVSAAACRPEIELTACTAHGRAGLERRFPQIRWLPESDAVRDDALRGADAWLGLGDTPFQLDSGPWLLDRNERERRRCAALGKPMYLLGVGCESREAAADPRSLALLAAAECVWTRDGFSAETLRLLVPRARLRPGADVAHLAFSEDAPPPREPGVIGMLLAFERSEQFDLDELAVFIERRAPGGIRWLVQEYRALPHLERWILERLAPEARARLSVMEFDYERTSPAEYLRAFGTPNVTITSRYHGAVVAAWHGSAVVVVSRSTKLSGVADELGVPRIERASSAAELKAALEGAVEVPRERLRALRRRAAAMCEAFFDDCAARTAATEPLAHDALRTTIEIVIPRNLRSGEVALVPCAVTNRGGAIYASAPPHPVELCYRWYAEDGTTVGEGTWLHTALPRPLPPGERLELFARIAAPPHAGRYTLGMTLLQENVAWFDDADPANGVRGVVTVGS